MPPEAWNDHLAAQPRISHLVHGKIDLVSIDTLVDMLARAGIHVDVVVSHGQHDAA